MVVRAILNGQFRERRVEERFDWLHRVRYFRHASFSAELGSAHTEYRTSLRNLKQIRKRRSA